jgi:hypothetical protein
LAAEENSRKATKAKNEAVKAEEIAEAGRREVERQKTKVDSAYAQLKVALEAVQIAKADAERNYAEAVKQKGIAEIQTLTANEKTEVAEREFVRAERALNESKRLLMLSIAQSLEVKSVGIDDPQLAGLTAMQGYLFHTLHEGNKYDPYVFNGLYYANAKLSLKGLTYNAINIPGNLRNHMTALAVSKKGNSFYTTGNDGRIFKGDYGSQVAKTLIGANAFPNRVLALSKDEQYLVNGSDSSVQIYNLANPGSKPLVVKGHKGPVNDIKFLPDNSGFISAGSDRTLRFTNQQTGQSRQLLSMPFDLKSIDVSADGKLLVGGSAAGQLVLVNLTSNSMTVIQDDAPKHIRIYSVAFHPDPSKQLIAYGAEVLNEKNATLKGIVKLFDLSEKKVTKELSGHKAGISHLGFSPDGLLLASAGLDHKLQMWVVDKEEDLPIVMDNNNGSIWNIGFTEKSDFLIASCNNGEIRVWPTDPKILAEQIKLQRNMTPEEWKIYVANDIPYESTCKSCLIKDF